MQSISPTVFELRAEHTEEVGEAVREASGAFKGSVLG
jgi:hypothetical protein